MAANEALFEIGLEEMPARFMDETVEQLKEKTVNWLNETRLIYRDVEVFATPRRLAIRIYELDEKQKDIEEIAKGPAKKIAVDENGEWTKAAIGFSRGQGKTTDDLYIEEVNGTEYVFVKKFIPGDMASGLLSGFKEVLLSLNFPKNMRWSDRSLRFIRPIRWIVALYGPVIIPMEVEGVEASNESFGHRFLGGNLTIQNPSEYVEKMENAYVLVNTRERKQRIIEGINELEKKNKWSIEIDAGLLNEVAYLVEYPTVFSGKFSNEFLSIPEEVLITSMKEHQRYFPVRSTEGDLLPYFIGVRNGDENHIENVAKGNEKVLRARLSDARFFYEEDQKQPIEENVKKLSRMVFQEKIGTLAEKVERVTRLTDKITDILNFTDETKRNAIRAAEISKFDLVSHMVNEFSELQGIMGEKYAVLAGENRVAAQAVREHYLPKNAHDILPSTNEGAVVSIADKLDTIVGCISVGLLPSGSQDPYGLRRQAIGVLQVIRHQGWEIDLDHLIEMTYEVYESKGIPTRSRQESIKDIREFFKHRATFLMRDEGIDQDIIRAVLKQGIGFFHFTFEKAAVLADNKHDDAYKHEQEALVRVLNLAGKGTDTGVDTSLFENKYEEALYERFFRTADAYDQALNSLNAKQALQLLGELADEIHDYFDHTMVMAEDEKLKQNRLSMLNKVADRIYSFADLSEVEWKQHN